MARALGQAKQRRLLTRVFPQAEWELEWPGMRGLPHPQPELPRARTETNPKPRHLSHSPGVWPRGGEGYLGEKGSGQVCRLNVPPSLATLQVCPGPISEKQNGERK